MQLSWAPLKLFERTDTQRALGRQAGMNAAEPHDSKTGPFCPGHWLVFPELASLRRTMYTAVGMAVRCFIPVYCPGLYHMTERRPTQSQGQTKAGGSGDGHGCKSPTGVGDQ